MTTAATPRTRSSSTTCCMSVRHGRSTGLTEDEIVEVSFAHLRESTRTWRTSTSASTSCSWPSASSEPRAGRTMKVVVDELRCDAHGVCVDACPEVFALDDDGRRGAAARPGTRRVPAGQARTSRDDLPEGRDHDRGLRSTSDELTPAARDRMAVSRRGAPLLRAGRRQGLGPHARGVHRGHDRAVDARSSRARVARLSSAASRHMVGSDEIVTYPPRREPWPPRSTATPRR